MRYIQVKVLLTVSPFHLPFSSQPNPYPHASRAVSPLSTAFTQNNRVWGPPAAFGSESHGSEVTSHAVSVACTLFISLASLFRVRFLYFQGLAASFCKTPGVWGALWPTAIVRSRHRTRSKGVRHSQAMSPRSRPPRIHQSLVTTHQSPFQWAIITLNHVQSSQTRAHQGRAVQHVPGQGYDQARLRQSARSGSYPQHAPGRHRSRSLDLRTQVPRLRPSLRRQRQLHPQPQMPQVPGRSARPVPLSGAAISGCPLFTQTYRDCLFFPVFRSGRNAVRIPTAGRNEHTWYT